MSFLYGTGSDTIYTGRKSNPLGEMESPVRLDPNPRNTLNVKMLNLTYIQMKLSGLQSFVLKQRWLSEQSRDSIYNCLDIVSIFLFVLNVRNIHLVKNEFDNDTEGLL